MRIFWASLAAMLAAVVLAAPALAGRHGLAVHGFAVHAWVGPPVTTHAVVHRGKALSLAQLPLLTTYSWAQPNTAPRHVPYGQP